MSLIISVWVLSEAHEKINYLIVNEEIPMGITQDQDRVRLNCPYHFQ